MQPNRPTPRKGQKFLDAKVFIVTLSLAITIGLWNLFSNNAIQTVQSAPGDMAAESSQPNAAAGSPPLPTLVPLLEVNVSERNSAAAAGQPGQSTALRAVAVPTVQIVQKHAPIVGQTGQSVQASDNGGGGGGGGGGSQPAPVTSTRSSK